MNGTNETYEYASYRDRFFALLIDFPTIWVGIGLVSVVWFVLSCLISSFAERFAPDNAIIDRFRNVLFLIVLAVGFSLWQKAFRRSGQTLGAKAMKIKVIPVRGDKLGISVPLSWFFFACAPHFALIVSHRWHFGRQSLLDRSCGTYTVKVKHDKNSIRRI